MGSLFLNAGTSLLALSLLLGCQNPNAQLTDDLKRCFNTYTQAIEKLDGALLASSVYFPDMEPAAYRNHVKELLVDYLLALQNGKFGFDQQGVLLIRFLGVGHHRYGVVSVTPNGTDQATMRIGIHFAYDANIRFSDLEPGSLVYVPKKPWPEYYTIEIGGENEVPREQLSYLEIDVDFQRMAQEWRVIQCRVVPETIVYEVSFEAHGSP